MSVRASVNRRRLRPKTQTALGFEAQGCDGSDIVAFALGSRNANHRNSNPAGGSFGKGIESDSHSRANLAKAIDNSSIRLNLDPVNTGRDLIWLILKRRNETAPASFGRGSLRESSHQELNA
jgi:hypothetical protein